MKARNGMKTEVFHLNLLLSAKNYAKSLTKFLEILN